MKPFTRSNVSAFMATVEHLDAYTEGCQRLRAQEDVSSDSPVAQVLLDIEGMIARRERSLDEATRLLQALEFSGHQGKCPVCVGWDCSENGETPGQHRKDCALAKFLKENA